ncbi:hypothetical protein ABW19_dt0205025 [Dactylella cylindrospora]|nr:hypothetical protein ABW19_dt0205025 [Dactylella cylindrospora]
MQIKALLVASLATLGSAAVVERQLPTDLLPSDILNEIPTEVLSQIPTELVSELGPIYSQLTAFLPLATAIPESLLSEIYSVAATLRPEDAPAFYSSVLNELPPDVRSSLSDLGALFTSGVGEITSALSDFTLTSAPTATETGGPSETGSETAETPAETSDSSETSSGTTSAPSASETPNAAPRSYVGLSLLGVAGLLGVAVAL